jgi:hypothetical protein
VHRIGINDNNIKGRENTLSDGGIRKTNLRGGGTIEEQLPSLVATIEMVSL